MVILYGEHEYCPKCDEEIRLSEQEVKNKDDLFLEDDKLIDEEILTNFKENKKEVLY